MRVGVGAKQEIGIAGALALGNGNAGSEPAGTAAAILSYKVAPVSWLAIIADAGVQDIGISASVVGFGGDIAVIVAPYIARDGSQLYTGARGGFSIPILGGQNAHAIDESLTVPVGYAIQLSKRTRFLLEAGFVLGFTQLTHELTPPVTDSYASYGGYGLLGFHYVFN